MSETQAYRQVLEKLVAAADSRKQLGLDRMNATLPASFDLQQADQLFIELWQKGIEVIDEERERRIRDRRKQKGAVSVQTIARDSASTADRQAEDDRVLLGPAEQLVDGRTSDTVEEQSGAAAAGAEADRFPRAEPSSTTVSSADGDTSALTADEQMELLANPQRQYIGELKRRRRLTREDAQLLAERAATGDESARQQLIAAFMPLVAQLAKRYRRSGVPLIELILAGNEGLVEAAHHYDPSEGQHFASVARWWIGHRLSRCVAENWRAARLPRKESRRLRRMAAVIARYRVKKGYEPSPRFLARALQLPIDEVFFLKGLFESPLSLHAPVGSSADGGTLADLVADRHAPDGARATELTATRAQLDGLLERLSVVEREILALRFGLHDQVERTLGEVARMTGMSRGDVKQVEARGLAKLRAAQ